MISDIRNYFRAVIFEIDSDMDEHEQIFVSDNIPNTRLDETYTLFIGDMSIEREDTSINGEVTVSLEIYKKGYNDIIDNFDEAYCKAIDIHALAMNQTRLDQTGFIKSVVATSVIPESIEDDDKSSKFTIQFIVTVKYNN